MNHALLLTKNCLSLTQKCVESLRAQDIPVKIHAYDNVSDDGTSEYLEQQADIIDHSSGVDLGVSAGWNFVLDSLFSTSDPAHGWHTDHVLVVNNDVILGTSTYKKLLECNVGFVTGSETTDLDDLKKEWPSRPLCDGPQFSCFLIRKQAWNEIGPFDDSMRNWASDCDYHARAHQLGIPLLCSPVLYYHERSSTIRLAPPKERRIMELQADADRETFRQKWGCIPGTEEYANLFK